MSHDHMIEMLDLDAEVLHDYHRDLIGWVGREAADRPRIVDLGAGSGTGSVALARELPESDVIAVDVSPDMLAHLRDRADAAGLGDRVRTIEADLDQPWPDFGPIDVIWAASSMHHMADPGQALASAHAALRPGGLLVIAELDAFPLFLVGTADEGLEERAHAEMARRRHEAGLHMHENWRDRIAHAGFGEVTERRFDIDLRPPLPAAAARYAELCLLRTRHGLEERLPAADLAALEKVAAGLASRADLTVRTVRTGWLARR
ncbi:MAG TPA: class I SAM-dependent methyltransferase [Asanoa sp.]|jgi:SAM-dependent methyltransferase|nr:class I SAM-dependent methyltransferase [Asanoa sp.]